MPAGGEKPGSTGGAATWQGKGMDLPRTDPAPARPTLGPDPDLLGTLEALLAACGGADVLAVLAAAARAAGYAGVIAVETGEAGTADPARSRLRVDLPAPLAAAIDGQRLLARRELRARPLVEDDLDLPGIGAARLVPVEAAGVALVFVPRGRPAPDWAGPGRTLTVLARLAALCLARQRPADGPSLRPRQREVLGWVASGKTTAETALILGLTRGAVEKHLRLAREALEAATTGEAIARAARAGLL